MVAKYKDGHTQNTLSQLFKELPVKITELEAKKKFVNEIS